ncbi:MAG: hypothetical protein JNL72_12230 [Flavipsychrobacter sp.]|nr:hypothetical protein [Flavipsychrobacter sp.]
MNDCINCTANLHALRTVFNDYNWTVVMPSDYRSDSATIIHRYKLDPNKIIWADTIDGYPTTGMSSKIIVTTNNSTRQFPLTNAIEALKLLKENAALENNNYTFTERVTYSFSNGELSLTNRISKHIYLYEKEIRKYTVGYKQEFLAAAYQVQFGKEYTKNLEKYIKDYSKLPALEPQIVKYILNEDSTIDLLTYCYIYEGDSTDRLAKKLFSVVVYNYVTENITKSVNLTIKDTAYGINEAAFCKKGNKYFFSINQLGVSDTDTALKFLSSGTLKEGSNTLDVTLLDFTLPDEYIDKNCYYNFCDPFISYPMVMLPIANTLFNVENNKSYNIPFNEKLLKENDPMNASVDQSKMQFHIFDISYHLPSKSIFAIYFTNQNYYLLKYNVAYKRLEYDRILSEITTANILYHPVFDKKNSTNVLFFTKDKKLHTYLAE